MYFTFSGLPAEAQCVILIWIETLYYGYIKLVIISSLAELYILFQHMNAHNWANITDIIIFFLL